MMIRFPCPSCGKTLKAADADAGGDGRCRCGAAFVIPRPGDRGPPKVIDYDPDAGSDSDPDLDLIPRRRKKAGPPWVTIGLVFALAAVTVMAVTMTVMKNARKAEEAVRAANAANQRGKGGPSKAGAERPPAPVATVDDDRRAPERVTPDDEPGIDRATQIKIATFIYAVFIILLAVWVIRDCRNRSIENG